MNKILTTIILLLSVLPSVGTAQIFGPSNYEDCIIEGMQGVASDVAAVAVRSACREKFSKEVQPVEINNLGWEVGIDGIGRCHLIWDGASLVQTAIREKPTEVFTAFAVTTPRSVELILYVPRSIMADVTDSGLVEKAASLFGGAFPFLACGKQIGN